MPAKKILTSLFILDVVLLNISVVFGFYVIGALYRLYASSDRSQSNTKEVATEDSKENGIAETDVCGDECKNYIDEAVKKISLNQSAVALPAPTGVTAVNRKERRVYYMPVPGSGSTNDSSKWVDLSGTDFYFNKSDYQGYSESYFEANIKLLNGNGEAIVRIFDVTHAIAVTGSEVKSANQSSTLVISQNLSFWSGNNLYRIQAKSLTADTTVYESGRLKIITEE